MDENPLQGEPGAFVIQKVNPKPGAAKAGLGAGAGGAGGEGKAGKVPPPPLTTDLPAEIKKGKGAEKSPLTPGGGKRRKKSRNMSTTTPK